MNQVQILCDAWHVRLWRQPEEKTARTATWRRSAPS